MGGQIVRESVLGKLGVEIWRRANGIDLSPVVPYSEEKSISTEQTFATDTINVQMLEQILTGMVEKLAFKLRKKQKLVSVVTVKIRYSNIRHAHAAKENRLHLVRPWADGHGA